MHTVLIVEDDEHLRSAFEMILRSEGFTVAAVENGKEALGYIEKSKPDVILLDLLMPVMGGLEFLQKAKLVNKYPDTVVILCSNVSDPLEAKHLTENGVTKVVLKSELSPNDLAHTIKQELKVSQKGIR